MADTPPPLRIQTRPPEPLLRDLGAQMLDLRRMLMEQRLMIDRLVFAIQYQSNEIMMLRAMLLQPPP